MSNSQTKYLPTLAGVLIGTSYIPFPPWALFFCLVPLMLFWSRASSAKQAFFGGWVTQFILTLIGFHWVAYTAVEFGHFPWWGGLLALLGFSAIGHLHYPLAAWIAWLLSKKLNLQKSSQFVLFVLVFALTERFWPMIFPWHLGYPWIWAQLPGHQFADVIGFEGLNYVTILTNALLAAAISEGLFKKRKWREKTSALIPVASALLLLLATNLAGLGRGLFWQQTDSQLSVLAVQGNIGNYEKLQAELRHNFGYPVVQKYLDLSREGLTKNPDSQIIIWPETAFPLLLDWHALDDNLQKQVRSFLQNEKRPLLTGAYSRDPQIPQYFNGLFALDGVDENPLAPYRKSILLAFGETFPFAEYFPYMEKLFPNQSPFGRGNGPKVMPIKLNPTTVLPAVFGDSSSSQGLEVRIGPQICYEGLFPWFSARLAHKGAQIFVNVTNDSWFGKNFEPQQHLYMTLARAIEFRRPLIRSTNTGITTAILASGEIQQKSPIGEEWSGAFRIAYISNPPHTFYEKYGFAWPWVLVFLISLLIVFARTRHKKLD